MLNIETKKHDQFTLELKVGYSHGDQRFPVSDFVMNTWVFIPDSLYINQKTYTKSDFYRDTRSHIRLMTPIYSLHELVEADCQPFQLLAASWENYRQETSLENRKELEHQLKMLGNIVRSALRSRGRALALEKDSGRALSLLTETFQDIAFVQSRLRTLFLSENKTKSSAELPSAFRKTDAYIACTVAFYLSKVSTMMKEHHRSIREAVQNLFVSYFEQEQEYLTAQGYPVPMLRDKLRNQEYLKQMSALRRFVESDLYLFVRKKNNTFLAQQILFMLAAGLSMIFATIVSFSFQQTYGNFTRPLFIALVVSYMFKDRIKDFLRYWFANKLGSKYYDYRTKLDMRGKYIGQGKEGFDFVNETRIPEEVKNLRMQGEEDPDSVPPESILLYRRRMILFGRRLSRLSRYAFPGVNEIIRINLKDFLRRMDNPHTGVPVFQKTGDFQEVQVERLYHLVFIVQFSYQGHIYYKRYRLEVNRRGLKQVREW